VLLAYSRGLQLAARWPNLARQGKSIGLRGCAKILFHFSVLKIYLFILIINEILILGKLCSVMQGAE